MFCCILSTQRYLVKSITHTWIVIMLYSSIYTSTILRKQYPLMFHVLSSHMPPFLKWFLSELSSKVICGIVFMLTYFKTVANQSNLCSDPVSTSSLVIYDLSIANQWNVFWLLSGRYAIRHCTVQGATEIKSVSAVHAQTVRHAGQILIVTVMVMVVVMCALQI